MYNEYYTKLKSMENKKEKDVIWPIRMKKSLKDSFKKHCDKNGYSMNKRIKILIERDVERKE